MLKSVLQELSFRDVYSLLNGTITEINGYTGGRSRLLDELKQPANGHQISVLLTIRDHITALLDIIGQQLSAGQMPEMSRLLKHLNIIIEFSMLSESLTDSPITTVGTTPSEPASMIKQETTQSPIDQPSTDTVEPASSFSPNWYEVKINNRDEARMLLEKVKIYFLTHEPSHPAPMMIDRIQQLIDRNFIDIIYDLAPEGLNQLAIIFGRTDDSDAN
ncbi:ImpA domain protein [Xenorhabdus innexi]|uniref:ImpA domain protein n=1 Tax=Xenorhabdus innexi TaxID=290109 RepID=A0A2G0MY18_9GAMM|nr:ImpA domain protein [Xenorhabdus innexi]